ncbi:class I SAM-dependent methyltransferase [Acinetobacter baumannii]|uniref:Methyltransferase n=1 Tax=Acinetobacter baumannii TaxID=470 RepID=A0AAJ0QZP6_ACIBA|nr:class I SAM-dependent methyltransferase [Acinetobacter baumannii]KZA21874.1 hypothetical protein LV35_00268 [Acinetobacter baumannii]
MSYQPRWVNGKTVGVSQRDAEGRFAAIAKHLYGQFGFTALDLGAHQGYFAHRLADEFGAEVIAADDSPVLESGPGVSLIHKRLTPADILGLKHVDVALCLSVLHHVPQWRETLDALRSISDVLFVETAIPDEILPTAVAHGDSAAIQANVESMGGKAIAWTPGYDANHLRPLWVIE